MQTPLRVICLNLLVLIVITFLKISMQQNTMQWLSCMDFAEAIEISKRFSSCHLKIFKGFIEWGICDSETEGYVVLADPTLSKEPCFTELEDYVRSNNFRIDHVKDYLMICTPF